MSSLLFDSAFGSVVIGLAVGCLILLAALVALAKPRGAWLSSRLEPYGGAGGTVSAGRGTPVGKPRWRPQVDRALCGDRARARTHQCVGLARAADRSRQRAA